MTIAPHSPGSFDTVMSAVQVIIGGSVSFTVTSNEQGALVLPEASVAVHVTVVVPTGKKEPDAGKQLTETTTPHGSVTVGAG
ncbi:MAG TPA: hypothetical protein VEY70_18360 [Metabacillus sp.]|nr:hypothetical protein [Metabacillus sp.]